MNFFGAAFVLYLIKLSDGNGLYIYVIEVIPFVCLSVAIKLRPGDLNHDILFTVGSKILWERFL